MERPHSDQLRLGHCPEPEASGFGDYPPIAGKPAPTGDTRGLNAVTYLWELACRRWAAQRPQVFGSQVTLTVGRMRN